MALIDWNNDNWKEKENGDFIFDLDTIDDKIFDLTAQKWSRVIANANGGTEKNQIRKFYDKILELEIKSDKVNDEEFQKKVLPFIKMINSKVIYTQNKKHGLLNQAFVEFMQEAIKKTKDKNSLHNFKYLFEAIIGFYEKENPKKNIFYIKENKERYDQKNNEEGRR